MRKSWVTQRLVNRLPLWSEARELPHSVTQQFLNTMGEGIEDLYKYSINETSNLFLHTANADLMDIVHVIALPNDFEFGMNNNDMGNATYVAPVVKGIIDTDEHYLTAKGTLKEFWEEALPTRLVETDDVVCVPVIVDSTVSAIDDVTPAEFEVATKLVLTIAGCTKFVDLSRRVPNSFIKLTGVTERGLEEEEQIDIPYNGVFYTKKVWKSLDRVEQSGLEPPEGEITIELFSFNKNRELDKYQLHVTPTTEKLLYHALADHTFGSQTFSVEQQLTVTADTLGHLFNGGDDLQVVREIELMYEDASLNLEDIAVQPFTGNLFATDGTYLYIFDPYAEFPDCRGLKDRTPNCSMIIETDSYDYVRGDSITLRPVWRLPTKRILRNRWSMKDPNGTITYFNIEGDSVSASQAWITNKTASELVFGPFETLAGGEVSKQGFSIELDLVGTYQFILETKLADNTIEKDILPVQVQYKNALTRLALPSNCVGATGVSFDYDQRLWFLLPDYSGGNDAAVRAELATDTMLIDYENKLIYCHEEYDSVEVTESEDFVVEV